MDDQNGQTDRCKTRGFSKIYECGRSLLAPAETHADKATHSTDKFNGQYICAWFLITALTLYTSSPIFDQNLARGDHFSRLLHPEKQGFSGWSLKCTTLFCSWKCTDSVQIQCAELSPYNQKCTKSRLCSRHSVIWSTKGNQHAQYERLFKSLQTLKVTKSLIYDIAQIFKKWSLKIL